MVYNEELKREIPVGWQVKSFLDLADWTSGAQPPKSTFKYEPTDGYVRFIQNRDYSSNSNLTFIPISKNNKLCDEYDIMMDKYGEAGRTRYGLSGAYNVALARIVTKHDNIQEYLRSFLGSEPIFRYLYNACMASTRASLNEDILSNLTVVVPLIHLLSQYEKLGKDIIHQILSIKNENERLADLRDWLLPMLMNGQVEVG